MFGSAASRSAFAVHDQDKLEFIHRLVSGDVSPPEWLLTELRRRSLLILGVHLPEWLGRFILRAATRDRLWAARRTYYVAREGGTSPGTLAEFLRRFGHAASLHVFPGNAHELVAGLHERWRRRHPTSVPGPSPLSAKPAAPEARRRLFFISYGHQNRQQAARLHGAVQALGGRPWFDGELRASTCRSA